VVCRTLDAQRERRQRLVAAAGRSSVDPFIGSGRRIKELRDLASAVLTSDVPVLIQGETGTGKTLLARWLHDHGTRGSEPFIDLNCAGLSLEHAESELFGHQRGALNGAVSNKPGLLEVAHGGTLFLDEIGDLQLGVQAKLGKALEEGRFRRIGEVAARSANFRLLTATHRDLPALTKAQAFRDDLLFRINAVTLEIPPLRERPQDIAPLANALLLELTRRVGRSCPVVSEDAREVLSQYRWPGNVRELRNVLERALLFSKTDVLDREGLRFDRTLEPDVRREEELTLDDAERRHLVLVLSKTGGRVDDAAKLLKLSRSSLYVKLKKYGIKTTSS
jgi:DNA-binding NtrC family response regulator